MSERIILQRHQSIISKLRRKPLNFEQLQDYLQVRSEISGYRLTCSLRTFQRDIDQIKTFHNIVIEYNPSQKVYEIVKDENEEQHERLMEAFEVYNALNLSNSFSASLILEKRKALGTDNLYGLLHAIKSRREVSFKYRTFYEDSVSERLVQPVAVKEARNRWYLLCRDKKDEVFKSFGLDRIADLEITNRKFGEIQEYDPEEAYRYSFGIINGTGEKPQKVELSFTPREGRYIKSLPLHYSQQLVKETETETIFRYNLIPTYDLRMEILSYGDQVEVLKPVSLRKQIKEQLESARKVYK